MRESSVCIIKNIEGAILFLKRLEFDRTLPNVYCLPGGKLEDNESPSEACVREVFEETGLILLDIHFLCKESNMNFYTGVVNNLDVKISDEHSGYKFISIEDFNKYEIAPITLKVLNYFYN